MISTSTTFCINIYNKAYNDTFTNYLIQQSCITQEQNQIETEEAVERMIDTLETQLNISTEREEVNQFTNYVHTNDLHDQIVKTRTNFDVVCDTTQDIFKNEQEVRPFIEVIKTQLAQTVQSVKSAKATVSSASFISSHRSKNKK